MQKKAGGPLRSTPCFKFAGLASPACALQQGIGKTHVMSCPKGIVGRIIGRQGDTIKQLQRVTGACAPCVGDSRPAGAAPKGKQRGLC